MGVLPRSPQADCFAVGGGFLQLHPRSECLRGVRIQDGNAPLDDRGTVVILIVDNVDGAP